MTSTPTYACAGGPPHDWDRLEVWDLVEERLIPEVVEVNTAEGWLIRYAKGPDGKPIVDGTGNDAELRKEKVNGRFLLRYRRDKK